MPYSAITACGSVARRVSDQVAAIAECLVKICENHRTQFRLIALNKDERLVRVRIQNDVSYLRAGNKDCTRSEPHAPKLPQLTMLGGAENLHDLLLRPSKHTVLKSMDTLHQQQPKHIKSFVEDRKRTIWCYLATK
jgi:hypothetical protein